MKKILTLTIATLSFFTLAEIRFRHEKNGR